MIFTSPIVSSASGSIAGITMAHNKGGMYMRARTIPTNPGSLYQVAVRNAVTQLTSRWLDTLTPAQRLAWQVYADNVPMLNKLGQTIFISGISHYVRSNAPRLQAGLTRVDDAPTVFNLGDFTTPTYDASAATDDVEVTFAATDDWADETGSHLIIRASRPQNITINYFKGPFRFADTIDGVTGTPPTSPATITLPFAVEIAQRLFFAAVCTRADGRLSGTQFGQCLVGA